MIRKTYLNDHELECAFNIIKTNMINLGFNVSPEDKIIWCENVKNNIQNPNFYFYLVYLNDKIVGFVEIVNMNNHFSVCEVELNENAKHTKVILNIIKYILNCPEFPNVNEMEFSILKHNTISNKTFAHLGGKIIKESDKKYNYIINRSFVNNYLSRLETKA